MLARGTSRSSGTGLASSRLGSRVCGTVRRGCGAVCRGSASTNLAVAAVVRRGARSASGCPVAGVLGVRGVGHGVAFGPGGGNRCVLRPSAQPRLGCSTSLLGGDGRVGEGVDEDARGSRLTPCVPAAFFWSRSGQGCAGNTAVLRGSSTVTGPGFRTLTPVVYTEPRSDAEPPHQGGRRCSKRATGTAAHPSRVSIVRQHEARLRRRAPLQPPAIAACAGAPGSLDTRPRGMPCCVRRWSQQRPKTKLVLRTPELAHIPRNQT